MTLGEVRTNIDRVDQQIKQLFQERMELAEQVAEVKAQTGDDIFKPDREIAIVDRLTKDVRPEIKKEYTSLIRKIMAVSRKYQYGRTLRMRDCFDITWEEEEKKPESVVVPETEAAVCGEILQVPVMTVGTYAQAADAIKAGKADAGMGVLETIGVNAQDGIHNMLSERHMYINRCELSEKDGICRKIALFTDHLIVKPEHNRLKLMFVCENHSGSLSSILSMISDYNVNLTEIHSQPDGKEEWNYRFYAELEGNLTDPEMKALVYQLEKETLSFRVLGSYTCR